MTLVVKTYDSTHIPSSDPNSVEGFRQSLSDAVLYMCPCPNFESWVPFSKLKTQGHRGIKKYSGNLRAELGPKCCVTMFVRARLKVKGQFGEVPLKFTHCLPLQDGIYMALKPL